MFDDEKVEDGLTIRVYRFRGGKDDRKMLSMVVRVKGDVVDKAMEVINPVVEARKSAAKQKLEALEKPPFLAKWFAKKSVEEYEKNKNILTSKLANPLFDFDEDEGLVVLDTIVEALKTKGVKRVSDEKKSNGDMMEQVLLFR